MYQYKFVRLQCISQKKLWKPFEHYPEEDYHQIIRDQGMKGWRFVQIFAPINRKKGAGQFTFGVPAYYELIFERKIEDISKETPNEN